MRRLLEGSLALLLTVAPPHADPTARRDISSDPEIVRLALRPGSRLWLEGDSNLRKWSCNAEDFVPELRIERAGPGAAPTRVAQASLVVPVAGIECGIGKMNDNLREALNADAHPDIVFELTEADVIDPGVRGAVEVTARGRVNVAGMTRPIQLRVSGRDTGTGALRLRGSVSIQMTQYGIRPPTAMFGLLRTKDLVTINFDLTADYEQIERVLE